MKVQKETPVVLFSTEGKAILYRVILEASVKTVQVSAVDVAGKEWQVHNLIKWPFLISKKDIRYFILH